MSNINNGGPAFPDPQEDWRGEKGMTLRDYFAAKAMQGWFASFQGIEWPTDRGLREISVGVYEMADAMLKARDQ